MTRRSETLAFARLFAVLGLDQARALDSVCTSRRVRVGDWMVDDHSEGTNNVSIVLNGRVRGIVLERFDFGLNRDFIPESDCF